MAAGLTAFCFLFLFQSLSGSDSTTLTMKNKCSSTIWPAVAGTASLATTGFALQPGRSYALTVPTPWSGRVWGRSHCSEDETGKFSCVTGDCGSSTVECAGGVVTPPATLAVLKLNGTDGLDFYDVSLVDGFNLPMTVKPKSGSGGGSCATTGCVKDLNQACPNELKVTSLVGDLRKSVACNVAKESVNLFRSYCPRAYSQDYDKTNNFTCSSTDYLVTFCPKLHKRRNPKSAKLPHTPAPPPQIPPS